MPGMFEANIRILPRLNPDYRNVVEYGIVAGRKILCWSINHVNRHANNQLTKGTFRAPCMIRANTYVALDTALTTIRYAVSPTAGSGEVALKDSPYEINPLAIKNVLRVMHDDITAGWEDQDTVDDYEKKTNSIAVGLPLFSWWAKHRSGRVHPAPKERPTLPRSNTVP